MGLNQTKMFLNSKRNHQLNKKSANQVEDDICKQYPWQRGNIQKYIKNSCNSTSKTNPIKKVGRGPEQIFLPRRNTNGL